MSHFPQVAFTHHSSIAPATFPPDVKAFWVSDLRLHGGACRSVYCHVKFATQGSGKDASVPSKTRRPAAGGPQIGRGPAGRFRKVWAAGRRRELRRHLVTRRMREGWEDGQVSSSEHGSCAGINKLSGSSAASCLILSGLLLGRHRLHDQLSNGCLCCDAGQSMCRSTCCSAWTGKSSTSRQSRCWCTYQQTRRDLCLSLCTFEHGSFRFPHISLQPH